MLSEEQTKLDIKLARIEILNNKNIEYKKLLKICDQRKLKFKEEIISLRTQLLETTRME